jgi:hypothetical protein
MKQHRFLLSLFTGLALASALSFPAFGMETAVIQCEADLSSEDSLPSTCAESPLGELTADAAVAVLGTDFAVIPGGDLASTLEHGSVFESDLLRVIPEDESLVVCTVTLPELKQLLEQGLSTLVTDDSDSILAEESANPDFPQVSGFSMTYDVSAPMGERVLYFKIDGHEVDLTDDSQSYTLAATAGMLRRAGLTIPETDSGYTLRSGLLAYFGTLDSITEPDSRATAVGTSNYPLIGDFPVLALAAAAALIALFAAIPREKARKNFSFEK